MVSGLDEFKGSPSLAYRVQEESTFPNPFSHSIPILSPTDIQDSAKAGWLWGVLRGTVCLKLE